MGYKDNFAENIQSWGWNRSASLLPSRAHVPSALYANSFLSLEKKKFSNISWCDCERSVKKKKRQCWHWCVFVRGVAGSCKSTFPPDFLGLRLRPYVVSFLTCFSQAAGLGTWFMKPFTLKIVAPPAKREPFCPLDGTVVSCSVRTGVGWGARRSKCNLHIRKLRHRAVKGKSRLRSQLCADHFSKLLTGKNWFAVLSVRLS